MVPVTMCDLCKHWIQSGEEDDCVKHYGVVNVNEMDNSFARRLCISKLISMYQETFNDSKEDRMVTFLNSFNIDKVNVMERHEVDEMKFVISNVMENKSIRDMKRINCCFLSDFKLIILHCLT